MPSGHSQSELDLALRISRHLGSGELHVLWNERSDEPVQAELVRRSEPEPPLAARGLALMGAVIEAAAAVLGRGVARLG